MIEELMNIRETNLTTFLDRNEVNYMLNDICISDWIMYKNLNIEYNFMNVITFVHFLVPLMHDNKLILFFFASIVATTLGHKQAQTTD